MRVPFLTLGAAAIVSLTMAGCGTQTRSLPLQPVASAATANAAASQDAGSKVAIYFGAQPHPEIARHVGNASHSVRIARPAGSPEDACNKGLADALGKLRADAQQKGANAVINVKTRFHGTESDSDTDYTCGLSPSAVAIVVKGELVVLNTH
ncbi:signal peptidase [Paraburkholderia dinghuensis]|uniref:Signal peptidase n=1 Tax=Paraburkholderia dinghuensis TaxID=2305225 RepID=A0A3N6MPS8_9BURK|nr:signal peptidase [Paraburkholderia dinghuensis]RQH05739.1 signal peptidase [Paraburkholderia dinghuensis]